MAWDYFEKVALFSAPAFVCSASVDLGRGLFGNVWVGGHCNLTAQMIFLFVHCSC